VKFHSTKRKRQRLWEKVFSNKYALEKKTNEIKNPKARPQNFKSVLLLYESDWFQATRETFGTILWQETFNRTDGNYEFTLNHGDSYADNPQFDNSWDILSEIYHSYPNTSGNSEVIFKIADGGEDGRTYYDCNNCSWEGWEDDLINNQCPDCEGEVTARPIKHLTFAGYVEEYNPMGRRRPVAYCSLTLKPIYYLNIDCAKSMLFKIEELNFSVSGDFGEHYINPSLDPCCGSSSDVESRLNAWESTAFEGGRILIRLKISTPDGYKYLYYYYENWTNSHLCEEYVIGGYPGGTHPCEDADEKVITLSSLSNFSRTLYDDYFDEFGDGGKTEEEKEEFWENSKIVHIQIEPFLGTAGEYDYCMTDPFPTCGYHNHTKGTINFSIDNIKFTKDEDYIKFTYTKTTDEFILDDNHLKNIFFCPLIKWKDQNLNYKTIIPEEDGAVEYLFIKVRNDKKSNLPVYKLKIKGEFYIETSSIPDLDNFEYPLIKIKIYRIPLENYQEIKKEELNEIH